MLNVIFRFGSVWRQASCLFAAMCLLGAFPAAEASAAASKDKVVGGWLIAPLDDGSTCAMSAEFEDNVVLHFFWDARSETTKIIISSPNWNSLAGRDGEKVSVKYTLRGNVEYDEWTSDGAIILELDSGSKAIVATWEREYSLDLAVAFGLANGVKAQVDDRTIGSYNLNGSYEAILALRKCGADLLKKGGDPFAN